MPLNHDSNISHEIYEVSDKFMCQSMVPSTLGPFYWTSLLVVFSCLLAGV